MAEVSEAQHRQSQRTAAIAVAVVAVLSAAFIGLVLFLDNVADSAQEEKVSIVSVSETDPFYVLLIGSDSRKGTALYTGKKADHAQVDQHSDVMTLVRVDPGTYTITLVTVPRDTVLKGTNSKINDALLDGEPEKVVDAVEQLTGVAIDYYMMTTFTSFETLVNAMGGVTVDVPKEVTVPDPMTAEDVTLKPGDSQDLNGSETLVLARARKEYETDQDALRQVNVRNIEIAMIDKALSLNSEKKANALLLDLEKNTTTDMDMATAGYLMVEFITHREDVVIYSCTGPYEGGENEAGAWIVKEDQATWAELMTIVDEGGDPTGVVSPPTHS